MFRESYFSQLKYIGFIWILGISIIGLPLIFILLFVKGVVVGFTVGFSKSAWMEWTIISICICFATKFNYHSSLSRYDNHCCKFSLRMIRHQFIRKITEPLLPLLIRYTCFFLVIGVVLALASSVEAYASPVLMKEVVEAINKNKYF